MATDKDGVEVQKGDLVMVPARVAGVHPSPTGHGWISLYTEHCRHEGAAPTSFSLETTQVVKAAAPVAATTAETSAATPAAQAPASSAASPAATNAAPAATAAAPASAAPAKT